MSTRKVVVVGAGPAGLTAAWELVNAGCHVTVLERDPQYIGGLARTLRYKEFRFDVGAHRFFSKNPEITRWWRARLPNDFVRIKRLTRILYRQRFFHYPLKASDALLRLGPLTSVACLLSYLWRRLFPIRLERSFADWVTNRFGDRLFRIFFKTYTEKVWGIPCAEISSDWASQRIKGLSLSRAALDAVGFRQRNIKTLVDEFEYPRYGAGMMWEKTRDEIVKQGGQVVMGNVVTRFECDGGRIAAVCTRSATGEIHRWPADEFIVSMPLRDCVRGLGSAVNTPVRTAAEHLKYRDFIVVALIVARRDLFPDNWIYVHDPGVKVGRIENYNNWTPEMSPTDGVTCLEMEYFCSQGDGLWEQSDRELLELAGRELQQLGIARADEVIDGCVVRVEKAYPVYDTHYREQVNLIRKGLEGIANLQVIGRNGMHKYNNQDHAMLTGIFAARNLVGGRLDVWRVNTDAEYHEEQCESSSVRSVPRRITERERESCVS